MTLLISQELFDTLQTLSEGALLLTLAWVPCRYVHRVEWLITPAPDDSALVLLLLNQPMTEFPAYTLDGLATSATILSDVGGMVVGSDSWSRTAPPRCE